MNLPDNIYINNKEINTTNQKVYYSGNTNYLNAKDKINEIFKYTNIVYDKKTLITTKDEVLNKTIIARDSNCLITNMHEIIPIENIINIKIDN